MNELTYNMDFYKILITIILTIGLLEFIVDFVHISGIEDWLKRISSKYQVKIIFKALNCDFCTSFWFSCISFVAVLFIPAIWLILPSAVGWYWIINKS